LICAVLHSSTPILAKHQSQLLGFGFVSLKPNFRLEKDGYLERGIALDYLGAAWHKHSPGPLTIRCQKPYDTLPVCIGEVNLRSSLLDQGLRLSDPTLRREYKIGTT
jgi:hypothetical protein